MAGCASPTAWGPVADRRPYLLQVGMSLAPMDAALARYRDLLLWRVPFALLVAVAASWWLSGFALLPLSRVAAAAREINVQTLDRAAARSRRRRRARSGGRRVQRHARNGSNMRSRRCASSVPRWRTSCAPLSPRFAVRSSCPRERSGARHDAARPVCQSDGGDRPADAVDRSHPDAGPRRVRADPADACARQHDRSRRLARGQLEPIAAAKSIELRCEPSEAVVVNGDAGWLQRLLLNLIDNAVKFTRDHGRVVVRVTRERRPCADRCAGHRHWPVAGRCATGVRTILSGRSGPFFLHRRRRARSQPRPVDRGTASRHRHRSESSR